MPPIIYRGWPLCIKKIYVCIHWQTKCNNHNLMSTITVIFAIAVVVVVLCAFYHFSCVCRCIFVQATRTSLIRSSIFPSHRTHTHTHTPFKFSNNTKNKQTVNNMLMYGKFFIIAWKLEMYSTATDDTYVHTQCCCVKRQYFWKCMRRGNLIFFLITRLSNTPCVCVYVS